MHRRTRWAVPAATAAVVAAAAAGPGAVAEAAPDLPELTAQEVLVLAAESEVEAFTATVETSSDLGLPELPSGGSGSDPDGGEGGALPALLAGESTLRVEKDGHERLRVQLREEWGEKQLVRNGTDVWTYDFADDTATHVILPERDGDGHGHGDADEKAVHGTPQEMADRLLDAVDPTTLVEVGSPVEVAGRDAYELLVSPRTEQSLLRQAALAVDAETGMVLRVRLSARGQEDPAFQVAVTELDLSTPDASRFEFTPPEGAEVEEYDLSEKGGQPHGLMAPNGSGSGEPVEPSAHGSWMDHGSSGRAGSGGHEVHGEGWLTVVEMPLPQDAGDEAPDDDAATSDAEQSTDGQSTDGQSTDGQDLEAFLDAASVPVEGGRLVSTALVNVLLTDDGRVLMGAVTPDVLLDAAAG
jgi:outer membrane lipoprotein-sorting protein